MTDDMVTAASCCCLYPRCITRSVNLTWSRDVSSVPSTWHHALILTLVIGLGTIMAVCDTVCTIVGCCSCNIIEQRPSVLASD